MKKVIQRYSKILSLIIAFILSTQPQNINGATNPALENKNGSQNPEITLTFPDQIKAGTEFSFSVNIKDQTPLLSAGHLSVQFTEGFLPFYNGNEGIEFSTGANTAIFKWEQLTDGNLFHLSFSVKTTELEKGVYPVRAVYESNNKVIKQNAGLYVIGKVKTPEDFVRVQEKPSPISIRLIYPEEVLLNDSYRLEIEIAKGKNTGGAEISVRIPPASNISVNDLTSYSYKPNSGKLNIRLESMPPNPVFTIEALVQNIAAKKAVYPISARVVFDNKTTATFSDYIFLTDQLSGSAFQSSQVNAEAEENTDFSRLEATFSELDKLLDEWTTSTIGNASGNKNNTQAKQAENTTSAVEAAVSPEPKPAKPAKSQTPAISQTSPAEASFFTVQIAASEVEMPELKKFLRSLQISEALFDYYDGQLYRYNVGEYEQIEQAKAMRLKLVNKGFSDAFVVKYEDGKRVMP
jgi:hypothetical protein